MEYPTDKFIRVPSNSIWQEWDYWVIQQDIISPLKILHRVKGKRKIMLAYYLFGECVTLQTLPTLKKGNKWHG